jgi:hypothetical protein
VFYCYHLLFVWAIQMMFSIQILRLKACVIFTVFNMCYMSNPSHSINLINIVISRFLCNFSEERFEVLKMSWLKIQVFLGCNMKLLGECFVKFLQRTVMPSSSRVNSQRRILLTKQYNITSQKTWIVNFNAADYRTEWQSFRGIEC